MQHSLDNIQYRDENGVLRPTPMYARLSPLRARRMRSGAQPEHSEHKKNHANLEAAVTKRWLGPFAKLQRFFARPKHRKPSSQNTPSLSPPGCSVPPLKPQTEQSGTTSLPHDPLAQRDTRLLSLSKLFSPSCITPHTCQWFHSLNTAVRQHMNSADFDASHDYEHVVRVTKEAYRLWEQEKHRAEFRAVDPIVICVGCLVHDVVDEKYITDLAGMSDAEKVDVLRQRVRTFLVHAGADMAVCEAVVQVVPLVSFTREMRSPELVQAAMEIHPALKIIQDADRLDALGPIGVARLFVYGGVKADRRNNTILTGAKLIEERLSKYSAMMKTETGRKEAERRLKMMMEFKDEFVRMANCDEVLEDWKS